MAINLASRLSAITTDSFGVSHLVWVENAAIWHAVYDSNSATWVKAESIANIGTQSVTSLNLIANDSLIQESGSTSTNSPGLAVVYQQGKDNDSNFFYTAAQYDANGNLQWLNSPQALTADQVGDLEPRAIAYQQKGITDVLVVGQKVNIEKTANLGIREDTDLYYQTFFINSNQFASSLSPVNSTNASYNPQTSKDGVVQGNLYTYPGQTVSAPAASYSVLSASEATSAISTATSNSSYNGLGFNWNASESFNTNLLSLNFFQNPPGSSSSILSGIFNKIYISGTLQGSSGNNPELTLFGGGDSTDGLLLNAIASLGFQGYNPDNPADSNNYQGGYTFNNGNPGNGAQKGQNSSFSPSITLTTLYSYANDPTTNFPLNNMTGSLALGLGLNVPLFGYDNEKTGKDGFKASLNFVGSIGVVFQWQVAPTSLGSYDAPVGAYLSPNPSNPGGDTTLAAVAVVPVVDAAAAIALVIGSSIRDVVNTTENNLTAESYLLGIPISAGLEGIVQVPLLLQLSASAKLFLAGTLGRANQQKTASFTLGFPLSLTVKLLGFLGGTIEVVPTWTWGTVPPPPPDTSSVSPSPTTSLASVSPLSTLSESSTTTSPTASVNGSLLSIAFPTALNTQINPAPTEFTVTVTDTSGNLINIPVFDVIVQENSVILRLEQTIPYSTLNDQPFSDIQVSYIPGNTPSTDLTDTQGQLIPSFTNLAVTNNTSQNFVYFYNPTSGTDNNYATTQQQIAINFNTPLNTNSNAIPLPSQFVVTSTNNNNNPVTTTVIPVSTVGVNQNSVTLTLAQNIPSGDTYTVQYTPNSSGINNLQDASDNPIPTFTFSSTTSPTEAGIVNSIFASASNININPLIANLSKDFAQDSPPTLASTANGEILIAWSSDTPPLTPVSALTDGSKIYLTFADNLNNAINQLPTNSQFTIIVNGNQDNVTVSNVALDENTIILNLSNNIQASDITQVSYSLNLDSDNNSTDYEGNLNLTDATNTVLWVPNFNSDVTFTSSSTIAPNQLQAGGLSNLLTLTFDQVLNTENIPNGSQFTVFVNNDTVTVNNVNVYATSVTLTLAQAIGQGDVISVSYNTNPNNTSDNLASNSNGTQVNSFTTNNVITTSSSPGTVIKVGTNNNTSSLFSIPGTSGLNFDAVADLDQQTQSNIIVWVHADEVDLPPLSIPGQVYTSEQTTLINNSLSASDIYYSVLGANNNQWSIAAPLVSQQPGQDTNVTLGEGPNGELMAAWLNTQQDSDGNTTTTINWSSLSWYSLNGTVLPTWSTPQIVLSEITPDPATNLSISSINGQPAIFWTETQAASYSTKVFDQNPLIYLRLADLNGTTAKNSGQLLGSANGTYNGDFTLRQVGALEDTTTQTGDPNPAVLFNGGGVTLNTAIPVTNQGFTVEFWFKLPSLLSAGQTLNLVSMGGIFAIDLASLAGGTALSFSLANADSSQIQTTVDGEGQTIQADDWYYVAGTYSGPNQTLSLYLNGSPVGSLSNVSFSNLPSSGTLALAGSSGSSSGSVYLDEVAFYPSVLTYSDVSAADITAANFQNITGNQLVDLLSGANQIGNHYDAQYVKPLPPGPQTHYSIWDSSSNSWETPSQIDPILKPVATSLSDANNPIWDIVSDSVAPANGNISPNGRADYVFQISLTGQQTQTIVGIVLSVSGTNMVWTVGTNQNGELLSPLNSNAWQLGVLVGDTLLNSRNPDAPSFNYRVMGSSETFTLFGDTSESMPTTPIITATVYFEGNDTPISITGVSQLPNAGGPPVVANSTDILGTNVLGIATVTEANDSALSLIDSGFVIDTNNSAIGSVLASAFNNSDGSLAYVAVGNRGYTNNQGSPLNNGTVQVLFNGGYVLSNSESNPLTTTDLTGNPDGVLITGLTDTGTANKNVAISLATGDIDGDTIDDLVIGDANVNGGNGTIYVFYGSYLNGLENQNRTINVSQLSTTPSSQGFLINGIDAEGFAGFSVAVGNFNGDDYEDIAFGAPLASNNGTTGAGKVYVVNGFAQSSSSVPTANPIYTGQTFSNIPNPDPADPGTFVTVGEGAGFSLGVSHYTLNGATTFSGSTTTDDLFIGAPGYQIKVTNQWNGKSGLPSDSQSLYPDTTSIAAGAVYVLSSSQGFSNGPISTYTGPGVPGANGVAAHYFAGTAIASSDFTDLDGDGHQDLAISATGVNSNTGVVYVVSGGASKSTDPQDLSLISNLIINGGLTGSKTGTVITAPGDLNDDGYQDFLITAPQAANGTGQNYLLFGSSSFLGAAGTTFDLNVTATDNKTTFLLNGSEPLQLTGTAAIGIGDINNDGVDDLMLTASNAEQAYAVFGHPWLVDNGSLKLANISGDNGFVIDGDLYNVNINYILGLSNASNSADLGISEGVLYLLNPFGQVVWNSDNTIPAVQALMQTDGNFVLYSQAQPLNQPGNSEFAVFSTGTNGNAGAYLSLATDGGLYILSSNGTILDTLNPGSASPTINGVNLLEENQITTSFSSFLENGTVESLSGNGHNVVMLGDVNGDGFADVLSGGSSNGAVIIFGGSTKDLLDAAVGTNDLIITVEGAYIQQVTNIGDYNGDGLSDFGVLDGADHLYVVFGSSALGGQGTLSLNPSTSQYITTGGESEITGGIGDYNGDGYDDFLISDWIQLGGATFSNNREVQIQTSNLLMSSVGDINGDGYSDIALGNPNSNVISPNVNLSGNGQATVYFGNASASSANNTNIAPPSASISGTLNNDGWGFYHVDQQTTYMAPSFAVFNGYLYMVYNSSDSQDLFVQRSADGYSWEGLTNLGSSFETYQQASLAVFDNILYLAFTAKNDQVILAPASLDSASELGISFSTIFQVDGQTANSGPTLVTYDDALYVFFEAQNKKNAPILYNKSSNPSSSSSWNGTGQMISGQSTSARVGATVVGDTLIVSFLSSDSEGFYTSTTTDGSNWTTNEVSGQTTITGPSLATVGNEAYLFFLSSNGNEELLYITSTDQGATWSSPSVSIPGQTTIDGPSPIFFNESLLVGFAGTNIAINISSSNPIYELNQTQQFGQQLQNIGDFNGDGIADLAVLASGFLSNLGSLNNNLLENNQGAILVYYGTTSGITNTASPDVVLAAPPPTASTSAAINQAILLSNFSGAGDINGDGYDDLLIASPNTALDSSDTTDGGVFVVFGGSNSFWQTGQTNNATATNSFNLGSLSPLVSTLTLQFDQPLNTTSIPATSQFSITNGFSAAGSISVEQVVVNENNIILTLNANVNTTEGISIVYSQPSSGGLEDSSGSPITGFTASTTPLLSTSDAPLIDFTGVNQSQYGFAIAGLPDSQTGFSLGGGGDVNGDSFSDFIIGAPGNNDNLTYTIFGSDFNNTVSQTGTIGNDVMLGTSTGESFLAGQGNDQIYGKGGLDVVYAGPGDDYVTVTDTYFQRLDGGTGTDILAFTGYNGQDWDLTTLSPGLRLRNFEILVTEDYGANTLTLNSLTVTQLSSNNTLTLAMDDADMLILSSDFSAAGIAYQYNQKFYQYTSNVSAATVLVNQANSPTFTADETNSPTPILPSNPSSVTNSFAVTAETSTVGTQNFVTPQSEPNAPTQLFVSNPTVSELDGVANFTIQRTGDLSKAVLVSYLTQDGDGKAGDRYLPVLGQLIFAPNETTKTVAVQIPNNGRYVGDRQFGLAVSLLTEKNNIQELPSAFNVEINPNGDQIRRLSSDTLPIIDQTNGESIQYNVTSENGFVTLDLGVSGKPPFNQPLFWNAAAQEFQSLPLVGADSLKPTGDFNSNNGTSFYQIVLQEGGAFDTDGVNNGLIGINLNLPLVNIIATPDNSSVVRGSAQDDYISAAGKSGTYRLEGLTGNDVLTGSAQRDILMGGDGRDQLFGTGGVDKLYGDGGNDFLDGGKDLDFLYGGSGVDAFVLRSVCGTDRIMDFNPTEGDLLVLDKISFGSLNFNGNQILLGSEILAIVIDASRQPVTDFINNPQWFVSI